MIRNVEWYIGDILHRDNISNSMTNAYSFDDDGVVLVEYHYSREDSIRKIGPIVNRLNKLGVSTPQYIGYRVVGDFCYLLQEKAKGDAYSKYTTNALIEEASNIPVEHYAKFIKDFLTMSDYGLGLELRPRNFFYDPKEGFSFIDVGLSERRKVANNFFELREEFNHIMWGLSVKPNSELCGDELRKFDLLNAKRISKILLAFEQTFPNFKEESRWYLRELDQNVITCLEDIDYPISNLTLTKEEETQFKEWVLAAVRSEIEDIKIGQGKDETGNGNKTRVSNALGNNYAFFAERPCHDIGNYYDQIFFETLISEYQRDNCNDHLERAVITKMCKQIDPVCLFDRNELEEFVQQEIEECKKNDSPNYDKIVIAGIEMFDKTFKCGKCADNSKKEL